MREMLRVRTWIAVYILVGVCSIIASCGGGGSSSIAPGSGSTHGPVQIQHIVIIFQENRTVDNLFNGFPGADTVTMGQTSTGTTVALQPIGLEAPYDLDHSHKGFVTEYAGGNMNGFDLEKTVRSQASPRPRTLRTVTSPIRKPRHTSHSPNNLRSPTACFRPIKDRAFRRTCSSRQARRSPRPGATCW